MTDTTRSAPPGERPGGGGPAEGRALPDFTPVPRQKDRSNGWKPEVQRAFIEALADTGSVKAACRMVGRADHGAYQLRRHPEGAEFAAAWDVALDHGIRRLEDALMERALNGVDVPVYSYGKLVGTRTVFNDRLGMFMLRNRLPDRFAAGGGARALNAVDRQHLNRLKKQWRQEWQREQWELDKEEEKETLESLDRMLETMRRNRWNNMSPRARAAYEEARRIAEEDGVAWMDAELDEEDGDGEPGAGAAPAPAGLPAPAEPAGEDESEPPAGPRVRSLKDDGW